VAQSSPSVAFGGREVNPFNERFALVNYWREKGGIAKLKLGNHDVGGQV
jgi:hypothetical protein